MTVDVRFPNDKKLALRSLCISLGRAEGPQPIRQPMHGPNRKIPDAAIRQVLIDPCQRSSAASKSVLKFGTARVRWDLKASHMAGAVLHSRCSGHIWLGRQ